MNWIGVAFLACWFIAMLAFFAIIADTARIKRDTDRIRREATRIQLQKDRLMVEGLLEALKGRFRK